jgi:hypothetical protein
MGSRRIGGVRFEAYPDDHEPRHVHARYGATIAILEIEADGALRLSARNGAIMPPNAKRSDVRKILDTAAKHVNVLIELWETMHEEAD